MYYIEFIECIKVYSIYIECIYILLCIYSLSLSLYIYMLLKKLLY